MKRISLIAAPILVLLIAGIVIAPRTFAAGSVASPIRPLVAGTPTIHCIPNASVSQYNVRQYRSNFTVTITYHGDTTCAGATITTYIALLGKTTDPTQQDLPGAYVAAQKVATIKADQATSTYTWVIDSSHIPTGKYVLQFTNVIYPVMVWNQPFTYPQSMNMPCNTDLTNGCLNNS